MERETHILINDLRNGERTAQQRLLAQYGQMVFRQIARIVTQQEEAEEVYQDVFVKALRKIETFDERQASLSTWLCRIAYNESLNFVRRTKPNIVYIDERPTELEDVEDTQEADFDEHTVQLLEQALERLRPNEQAVISMFYYDGMSLADIAYVTGTKPSTIGSQLFRIRKKLYRLIKTLQQ